MDLKISLADAASARGCSTDYLLALAEAGQIQLYARIGPYAGEFRNLRGEPPSVPDARHGNLMLAGPTIVREPGYTVLLPHEAATLRTGNPVIVRVIRQPGEENGARFPFTDDDEFLLHLTEPQVVSVDQLCVIEASKLVPTASITKPVSIAAAQDASILAEIRLLGWNPQAMPVFPQGLLGARARVYASMGDRGATRGVFFEQRGLCRRMATLAQRRANS